MISISCSIKTSVHYNFYIRETGCVTNELYTDTSLFPKSYEIGKVNDIRSKLSISYEKSNLNNIPFCFIDFENYNIDEISQKYKLNSDKYSFNSSSNKVTFSLFSKSNSFESGKHVFFNILSNNQLVENFNCSNKTSKESLVFLSYDSGVNNIYNYYSNSIISLDLNTNILNKESSSKDSDSNLFNIVSKVSNKSSKFNVPYKINYKHRVNVIVTNLLYKGNYLLNSYPVQIKVENSSNKFTIKSTNKSRDCITFLSENISKDGLIIRLNNNIYKQTFNGLKTYSSYITFINTKLFNFGRIVFVNDMRNVEKIDRIFKNSETYMRTNVISYQLFTPRMLDNTCLSRKVEQCKRFTKSIVIPVEIGKYSTVLKLDNQSDINIVSVIPLPYGLKYNEKEIFGRIMFNTKYTMNILFSDNSALKIILEPYSSDVYTYQPSGG